MADFLGLFGDDQSEETSRTKENDMSSVSHDNETNGSLQLHKEELDITKNSIEAGEVVLSKDVVEEQKTVDVPVMHEEVVIKRKKINNERSDDFISSEETIHIPVSQEEVEVNKYTVTTEEITASKRQVEESQQIQETLKHEEAHVNTTGSVDIISDESDFSDINHS